MKKITLTICLLLLAGCTSQNSPATPAQNGTSPTDQTEQTLQTAQTTQAAITTQNWKKYCSDKFHFEILYPPEWTNNLSFISDKNEDYQLRIDSTGLKQQSSFSIFTTDKDMAISKDDITKTEQINLLGQTATSYTLDTKILTGDGLGNQTTLHETNKRIVLKKDGIYYHFMLNNITDESRETLEGILASVRFLTASEQCRETKKPGIVVLDGIIYYGGDKMAEYKDGKIILSDEATTYAFPGDPQNLFAIADVEQSRGVYHYANLTINLPRENSGEQKIIYQCTSPLLPDSPYFYCNTNGKDYLEQYEFGEDYRQFSTGGGYDLKWKKIYIRDIGGKNFVFEGVLDGDSYDVSAGPSPELDRIKSKKYLDEIIKTAANKDNEKMWKGIVDSFSLNK